MEKDFEISVIPSSLLNDSESIFSDPEIRKTIPSDLALYTGCHPLISDVVTCWTDQVIFLKKKMVTIDNMAQIVEVPINKFYPCIRPVIKFKDALFDEIAKGKKTVFLGRYPQTLVSPEESALLSYYKKDLFAQGSYCFYEFNTSNDGWISWLFDPGINVRKNSYLFEGQEYLNLYNIDISSNEEWFKVEPIEWMVDEKNRLLIAEKALLSGIPMGNAKKFLKSYDDSYVERYICLFMEDGLHLFDFDEEKERKIRSSKLKEAPLTPDKRLVLIKERLRLFRQANPEHEEAIDHMLYHLSKVEEELGPGFQKIKK